MSLSSANGHDSPREEASTVTTFSAAIRSAEAALEAVRRVRDDLVEMITRSNYPDDEFCSLEELHDSERYLMRAICGLKEAREFAFWDRG